MCLENAKGPFIAKENIPCWIIVVKENCEHTYSTVYYNSSICKKMTSNIHVFENTVEEALHSHQTLEDAKTHLSYCIKYYSYRSKFSIKKCIIPKGSTYYTGTFDLDVKGLVKCFASDRRDIVHFTKKDY